MLVAHLQELRFRFVFLFTVLLFVKVFHWLSAFRVEQFYTELAVTPLTHARIMLLMGLLLVTDVFFFVWQAKTLLLEGPSFLLLFAFEYVILWSNIVTTMLKYLLYIVDMRRNGRWSNKSVYTFYLNLLSDLFQLFVYLIFFAIVLSFYGIPLHIVRDLYNAFGNFKKRIADFIRYRRVILHMNQRFPAATAEELSNVDATCIVCREEMVHPNARKLPCGHIFHFDCLRSWLEENTTCPTCRNPVEIDATPNRAPAAAAPRCPLSARARVSSKRPAGSDRVSRGRPRRAAPASDHRRRERRAHFRLGTQNARRDVDTRLDPGEDPPAGEPEEERRRVHVRVRTQHARVLRGRERAPVRVTDRERF